MPTVHEGAMLMPDMIKVEVRDGAIDHVGYVAVQSPPDSGTLGGGWLNRSKTTGGAGSDKALVTGVNKQWLKFEDVRTTDYLDRDAADVAGDYGTIGGLTVTNVYRKTQNYDGGISCGDGGSSFAAAISMRHYLYLKLSGNLAHGTHTIDFPTGTGIADYSFTFNDRSTRFAGIKSNQYGHGTSDLMKFAYLAEWVPGYGTEGRVDFSAITNWHIMNRNGVVVWSAGAAPVLRITATDTEGGGTFLHPMDSRLTSTTQPVRTITGYTNADPCVITFTGDDLANDMIVRIQDVRQGGVGVDQCWDGNGIQVGRNFTLKNVNNAGPKTAELYLDVDVGADVTYDTSQPSTEYMQNGFRIFGSNVVYKQGGKLYETVSGINRSGTNVYGLDYSTFVPAEEGIYYIYIPGYGISHPIYIDNAALHNVAGNMAAGEYHHRHDIELDGRFGYTRPAGFSPTAQIVYQSLLPLYFSNEVDNTQNDACSHVEIAGEADSPIHTSTPCSYVIGHHDAGDHDSRIGSHFIAYYGYLDFYEQYPTAASATDWNIPTVEELYPADTTYAGTAILPDCLQQGLWFSRSYLQGVSVEGWVRGGTNWSTTSSLNASWLVISDEAVLDDVVFNYAPDHISAYFLCTLLAKCATCLRKWDTLHSTTTFATLAQYLEDKAVLIWGNADLIYDGATAWGSGSVGAVTTARTALYGDYRTVCETLVAGRFDTMFATNQAIVASQGLRLTAAAALYKATGDITYGNIVTGGTFPYYRGNAGCGAWEYATATHANRNTTKQAEYKAGLVSQATTSVTDYLASDIGFKSQKRNIGDGSFGTDGTDWSPSVVQLITAYMSSEQATPGSGAVFRKALEDGWNYGLGANLTGKSLTSGLGTDQVKVFLHNDSAGMGVDVPKGIMSYGPCFRNPTAPSQFQSSSPSQWQPQNSSTSYTADYEHEKSIYPTRFAWPRHEHFYECPALIEMTEYVFGGSIGPQQWVAAVLWAENGGGEAVLATDVPTGYTRGNAITS